MNELIPQKTWWQRNKKWTMSAIIILFFCYVIFNVSGMKDNASNYIEAYSNPEVYQNAVSKANENPRVAEVLGTLEPIDNLAIAEGNVVYSNDNKALEMSIRVSGDKAKGKIQILAEKIDGIWKYKDITIKIKNPEEVISVIE